MRKNFRVKKTVRKPLARSNHRTTLPQSALRAASSLREGAGRGCTIHCAAHKSQDCGRFSSPLRRLRIFYISPCNVLALKSWHSGWLFEHWQFGVKIPMQGKNLAWGFSWLFTWCRRCGRRRRPGRGRCRRSRSASHPGRPDRFPRQDGQPGQQPHPRERR